MAAARPHARGGASGDIPFTSLASLRNECRRCQRQRKAACLRKDKYQEITAARKLLELPEAATMQMIKANYRRLLATWHPDTCKDNKERCTDMTRDIVSAYKTIMAYCEQYPYSFTKEAINTNLSPEEWWFEHFGNDAWRGGGKTSE